MLSIKINAIDKGRVIKEGFFKAGLELVSTSRHHGSRAQQFYSPLFDRKSFGTWMCRAPFLVEQNNVGHIFLAI
jgi:hypothetical protein